MNYLYSLSTRVIIREGPMPRGQQYHITVNTLEEIITLIKNGYPQMSIKLKKATNEGIRELLSAINEGNSLVDLNLFIGHTNFAMINNTILVLKNKGIKTNLTLGNCNIGACGKINELQELIKNSSIVQLYLVNDKINQKQKTALKKITQENDRQCNEFTFIKGDPLGITIEESLQDSKKPINNILPSGEIPNEFLHEFEQ